MGLDTKLRDVVIQELERMSVSSVNSYARENHETLNALYNHEIIDDSTIEDALEVAVFKQARWDYDLLIKNQKRRRAYADHVQDLECFAYALENGAFSRREIKRIPFDHGETAQTYPGIYGDSNLLSTLREKLLDPPPLPGFLEGYDPHPVCSCGH